jgi:hypothetical protein
MQKQKHDGEKTKAIIFSVVSLWDTIFQIREPPQPQSTHFIILYSNHPIIDHHKIKIGDLQSSRLCCYQSANFSALSRGGSSYHSVLAPRLVHTV